MENWTGTVKGTNRGLVTFRLEYTEDNKINGDFTLFDADTIDVSAKVEGSKEDNKISAKLFEFSPAIVGVPTEGTVNLTVSEDEKELRGTWKTNVSTEGECVLYKLKIEENTIAPTAATPAITLRTLETKCIAIEYHSFEKKDILELFKILRTIATRIREDNQDCFEPIYAIKYDKEESIRTFNFDDFQEKLNGASKIWHVGFEFKEEKELLNLFVNLYHQDIIEAINKSNIQVSSTKKDNAVFIPEIARGFISKLKNKNWWFHHWTLEALIQLSAVIVMVSLSYMFSKKVASSLQSSISEDNTMLGIIFIAALLVLSNCWTYIRMHLYNYINSSFPVVDIICKPKSKYFSSAVVGLIPGFALLCIAKYGSGVWGLFKELIK